MGFKKRAKKYAVKFPLVIHAYDYHEFDDYERVLSEAIGEKVQYHELPTAVRTGPGSQYFYSAVFFVEETKEACDLIDRLTKEIEESGY